MSKSPGGVSKTERIQAVKKVLERWGLLSKKDINEKVGSFLNIEPSAIERALFRDLEELVRLHELDYFGETTSGELIQNPEHSELKLFKALWCLPGQSPFNVRGVKILNDRGADLRAPEFLRNYIRIERILTFSHDLSVTSLIFNLQDSTFKISIDLGALPFTVIISRSAELTEKTKKEITDQYGRRIIIFMIPIDTLSALKEGFPHGQLIIKVDAEKQKTFLDCGSANGTYILTVENDQLENKIQNDYLLQNKTRKQRNGKTLLLLEDQQLKHGIRLDTQSPAEIFCSTFFKMIAY